METREVELKAAWRSPLNRLQGGNAAGVGYLTQLEKAALECASGPRVIKLLKALAQEADCLEGLTHAFSIKKAMEETLVEMARDQQGVLVLLHWLSLDPALLAPLPCAARVCKVMTLTVQENQQMARFGPLLQKVREAAL